MYICHLCNENVCSDFCFNPDIKYELLGKVFCWHCYKILSFYNPWQEIYNNRSILHNLEGPARINYKTGETEFYYNGTFIPVKTLEEFKKALKIISFL